MLSTCQTISHRKFKRLQRGSWRKVKRAAAEAQKFIQFWVTCAQPHGEVRQAYFVLWRGPKAKVYRYGEWL